MTTQELCCGMNDNIGSMLKRTDEEGRTKGIIHDKRNIMAMSHFGHTFDIEDIRIRITKRLGIDNFCVRAYGRLQSYKIVDINNRVLYSLCTQSVRNQVVRTAIQIISCHNVIARLRNVLQGVSDSSSTRGHSQSRNTSLKSSHTVFEYPLRGVGESTIDVTSITQAKAIGCML